MPGQNRDEKVENALGDVRPLYGSDQDGIATMEMIVFMCMSKGSNKTRWLENALAESPGHFDNKDKTIKQICAVAKSYSARNLSPRPNAWRNVWREYSFFWFDFGG